MSDSVPSLVSVHRAIERWLACVDADENEALKSAAIADLLTYARANDPAWKAAREAFNGIIAAEEGWNGSDFERPPTGISKLARSALRALSGEEVGNG